MCYNPIFIKKLGMFVDCHKCGQCRLNRAREWAVRCHYELKEHKESCFVTLTYDNDNYSQFLCKEDMQLFIKRLRKKISPKKIKYFLCGEYGPTTRRAHYHAIIFGYDFPDKVVFSNSKKGKVMYKSATLEKLWGKGYCTVQRANMATVIYSALYLSKDAKPISKKLKENAPEFNLMSQGLGVKALLAEWDNYKDTDTIYIDGQGYTVPQAVLDKKLRLFKTTGELFACYPEYDDIKATRLERFYDKNPKKAEIQEKLADITARLERYSLLGDYDRQREAEKEFSDYLDRSRYRAQKKPLDGSI